MDTSDSNVGREAPKAHNVRWYLPQGAYCLSQSDKRCLRQEAGVWQSFCFYSEVYVEQGVKNRFSKLHKHMNTLKGPLEQKMLYRF